MGDEEEPKDLSTIEEDFTKAAEVFQLGGGSTLRREERILMTVAVQGITPELASHEMEKATLDADTRVRLAKIDAETATKVAELTHVAPVREANRPAIMMVGLYGALVLIGGVVAIVAAVHGQFATALAVVPAFVATGVGARLLERVSRRSEK